MDDQRRKLQVVNAANPSLRLSVAPPTPQPQLRVSTAAPQRLYLPGGQSYVDRSPTASTEKPRQIRELPKLNFAQRLRDTIDANTESDKIRRVNAGRPEIQENPGNLISNTIGAVPRMFNTAANQIVEVGVTGQQAFATNEYSKAVQELLAAQKSGDKARYDAAKLRADSAAQRVSNIEALLKATKSNYKENSGGLFNAGTLYNEQDSYEGKLSTGLRKIGAGTAEGMFDVASLGLTGVAGKQVAKQGIKQTLKESGGLLLKNAAVNTGQGASSSIRQGGDLKDAVVTGLASGAIGTVADVALAGAGGSLARQIGKARADALTKQVAEYFVEETSEPAIKTMLRTNLNVPVEKVDKIASYVAQESNPQAIDKLVKELSIDPNLELTPEIISRLRDEGVTSVKRDKDALYEAQYQDGTITARGQKELDDNVYHELGHHLYNTKLTPEEKALFKGTGRASQEAKGRPGYTQDNVNAEDFADYLNLASRGRINEVPKEYQAVIRKYAKIAEAQANDAKAFGTSDKYVYHADSTNAPVNKFAKEGIRPSSRGQSGSGVYLGNTIDATEYNYSSRLGDSPTMYRVDKQALIDEFGKYPQNKNGVQFDETTGEILLDGKRNIPPEFIEVKQGENWNPLVPKELTDEELKVYKAATQGTGDIQDATAKATGETAPAVAGDTSVAPQVSSNQATVTKEVSGIASKPPDTIPATSSDVFYHGTTPADAESIVKNGFNPQLSKGKLATDQESPYALFASTDNGATFGDHSAGTYGDAMVIIRPKGEVNLLDGQSQTWLNTMGTSRGAQESAEWAAKLKDMGYDGIKEASGEVTIINPSKFDMSLPGATQAKSILKPQSEVIPPASTATRPAGFAQSLSQTTTPQAVYEDLLEITTKPNAQTLAQASQDIVANEQEILKDILGKSKGSLNDVDNARALLLLDKAIADDNIPLATQIASKVNSSATENARAVQILSAIDKTTPTGAFKEAQKIVTEAQEKGLLPDNYTIPPEKLASINERAKFIQTLEMGTREHDIAVGELLADLKSIVPAKLGDKLNSIVNISLLLNPKTFIRNVLGNVAGNIGETISTAISTPIDMLVSLGTGKRTVALPSVIERFGGFGQGLKGGFEETNKGIRLGIGGNSKYDINTPVLENKVGQWMEKALGHSLSDLDKAFATSQMRDTINSLMKATGATKPTQEMLDIAGHEALYATYQGDSFIAKSLQGAKGWLNKANVKGFGLGDVVVRYPKTPGNLVAVGMDYSPYGFIKGMIQAVQLNKGTTIAAQREAVRNIGRGITGSGLIAGGFYLAKNNIITAKKSSDKDLNSLQRQQGTPPFSFNISAFNRLIKGEDTKAREGDVITNYDWLQPNAIQLSMGANMALNKDKGANDWISTALDQAATGLETIEEQPVLAQTGRFFKTAATSADQGGGIPNAITDAVTGFPSMLVPSVINQTAASLDNTARTTYDPNPAKMGLNKVVAKLPFANQSLEPAIDTFGNEIKRQQSDNPITRVFNSFVNPAFVTKIKRTPEGQMVLDIYNRSGETGQIPRVAAKKQTVNLDGGEGSEASSYTLSGKELTEFQKLTGRLAKETFAELANNPAFMALPDDQKAAEMQKKLTEINSYAKITVLGNKPKTMSEGVKALISGRVGDFASKSPENVTGIAKQYYDKTAYMDDATYKAWLNGEPDQVAKDTAAELNKKRPANTNELGAYNGLAKRYAEYEKAKADAKKDGTWSKLDEVEKDQEFWKGAIKDGKENLTKDIYDAGSSGAKDYWEKGYIVKEDIDKAIELDNELYASGLSKTLKFSKTFRRQYGYGVPTSPDGKSSGGSAGGKGGKKGSKAKEVTVQGLNERKLRFDPSPAPDVSAVPSTAKKKLKFNVPSSVQVTPVRLKL